MRDALAGFLLALEARGSASRTVGSYDQRLSGMCAFLEGRGVEAVEDVGAGDLDAWVASLYRQSSRWVDHPVRGDRAGGLSLATIAGRIQSAQAFFSWCVRRGLIGESPAAHLRKPKVDLSAGEKAMDPEDLALLVREAELKAERGRPRDLALLLFLADTGCRAGEVAGMRVGFVDLDECSAVVYGKTGKRVVDFTARTAAALGAWLAVRPEVGHDWVFVVRGGGPMTTRAMYEVLRSLARKAGVKGRFNPHSVRHLLGQHWADRTNLELVRLKLGHSDIRVTAAFYAGQNRARLRAATRRLSLVGGQAED